MCVRSVTSRRVGEGRGSALRLDVQATICQSRLIAMVCRSVVLTVEVRGARSGEFGGGGCIVRRVRDWRVVRLSAGLRGGERGGRGRDGDGDNKHSVSVAGREHTIRGEGWTANRWNCVLPGGGAGHRTAIANRPGSQWEASGQTGRDLDRARPCAQTKKQGQR